MSSFKRLPTSIRYLIARLRHWVQPTVWAPLAVLCAGGVFIWEVSLHPERLSIDDEERSASTSNNPPNPAAIAGLSPEEVAIAAEIDSLPVLVNQINRSNADFALLNSSVVKDKGLFDEIRDRDKEISQPSSAPKRVVSNSFLPLTSIANPVISAANNNPPNSSWQNSNATAALSPSGNDRIVFGQTIGPQSGDTAPANLSATSNGSNLGQKNETPLPLSPLQAAMKKYYIATNSSTTVTSTQKNGSQAKLPDRLSAGEPTTNQANIFPTTSTAQNSANPVNFPGGLAPIPAPTNTIINNSQQLLNPGTTVPESVAGLNLKVQNIPVITTIQEATPALPTNPYQTNLSGSSLAPESQPTPLPVVTPSTIPAVPNVGQSIFPSAIGGSKIVSPQFSPNSANSQFQPVQPSQTYLPNQSNFGVVPQNQNQVVQPIQPQTFSAPRQIPGRYIGGGEINTFANP
jgi:hypothetical protein